MRKQTSVIVAVFLFGLFGGVLSSNASSPISKSTHRGIHLVAMPLPSQHNGIVLLKKNQGIAKLRHALDEIYNRSPFNVRHIETLKSNGKVTIVYDANFPNKQLSSVTIAAFFPDFFQKRRGRL